MHLVWKRMEMLVHDLLRRRDLTPEEKFSAIKLALETSGLQKTPTELERIRKCVWDVEDEIQARCKKP